MPKITKNQDFLKQVQTAVDQKIITVGESVNLITIANAEQSAFIESIMDVIPTLRSLTSLPS